MCLDLQNNSAVSFVLFAAGKWPEWTGVQFQGSCWFMYYLVIFFSKVTRYSLMRVCCSAFVQLQFCNSNALIPQRRPLFIPQMCSVCSVSPASSNRLSLICCKAEIKKQTGTQYVLLPNTALPHLPLYIVVTKPRAQLSNICCISLQYPHLNSSLY